MSSALAAATEQKKSRAKSVPEFEPEQPQLQHSTGASAGLPRFMRAASGTEDGAAIQFKCAKCQEEEEKSALPVVQAKCACCGGGSCKHDHPEPAGLRHTAREGVADANRPLPHFDRIQTSFGRHDVSEARAQVGGPAARANESMGS